MTKEKFEEKYGEQLKLSEKKWMLMSSRANKDNNLVIVSGYREIDYDYLYFIYKDEIWEMHLDGGIRIYQDQIYTTRELFQLVLKNKSSIDYYPPANKILYRTSGVNGQIIVALDYFATKVKSVLDPVITIQVPKEVWGPDEVVSDKHILEELEEFLKSQGYHKTIIDYVVKNTDVLFIKQGGEWDMGYLDALIENAKFEENFTKESKENRLLTLMDTKMKQSNYLDSLNSKEFGGDIPKIRTFDTGARRDIDTEKEDYIESLSWTTLRRYAKYMKTQEVKYGSGNWKKGIPIEEYEKSLMRHIQKYFANKYEDANLEPEVDHLSASFFNLQGLIHETEKLNKN